MPVLSLGLSSLCLLSFSASSFAFWTARGLLLMRNLFSGMGGISSGRTVDVTTSSCSFSSAPLSASELFFSFFFCFFFSFFAFFLRFLDSFSDSSESEEESEELSESLELLLELEEARSLFFASFFALDLGINSPQFKTFTSAYGLLLGSVFWFSMV